MTPSEQSPAYDCENCGACCRSFPIFASEADARLEPRIRKETKQLPEHLAGDDKVFQLHPLPFQTRCAFLQDDQLCRIYATRPQVCRRFEAGSPQCIEARRRQGIRYKRGPRSCASRRGGDACTCGRSGCDGRTPEGRRPDRFTEKRISF